MKIVLFGQLKELAREGIIEIPAVADTRKLRSMLEGKFPVLKSLPYILAIDKKIVSEDFPLQAGQEIAVLPPYSGG